MVISRHAGHFRRCPPCRRYLKSCRLIGGSGAITIASLLGSSAQTGCVTVHHETYYLSTHLAGRKVALMVDAPTAAFDVLDGVQVIKRLPIKNVVRGQMLLEQFITVMLEQARSEERLRLALKAQWRRGEWDPTP